MARTTKQLSGGGKDKLIRALIAAEPAIDPEAGARLGECMCDVIKDVRVVRDVWERTRSALAPARNEPSRPVPDVVAPTAPPAAVVAQPTGTAFDPFTFSAVAILTKKGAAELATKLASIASAEHLQALAKAQHLGVATGISDVVALRTAIIAAAEARLAERRAAAS